MWTKPLEFNLLLNKEFQDFLEKNKTDIQVNNILKNQINDENNYKLDIIDNSPIRETFKRFLGEGTLLVKDVIDYGESGNIPYGFDKER